MLPGDRTTKRRLVKEILKKARLRASVQATRTQSCAPVQALPNGAGTVTGGPALLAFGQDESAAWLCESPATISQPRARQAAIVRSYSLVGVYAALRGLH